MGSGERVGGTFVNRALSGNEKMNCRAADGGGESLNTENSPPRIGRAWLGPRPARAAKPARRQRGTTVRKLATRRTPSPRKRKSNKGETIVLIGIWFFARPHVLSAVRVRENWLSLAFILRTSCQPRMSLASATFCHFLAALVQRRVTDRKLLWRARLYLTLRG